MMNNREPETITISLDEHDVKSLINSVVHQQHLLTQQVQSQTHQQQQGTQQRQMQQSTQQHHITVHHQQQNRQQQHQQQQPTISIIPHQVSAPVSSTVIPSTSTLIGSSSATIPVLQSGGSGTVKKRKPKLNQKLGQLSLDEFWPTVLEDVKELKHVDAKNQSLPLARIKKIMKLDDNAKMIAAEAPLVFAKACEFFIQELTMRAWHHTEENKRRTLQRSDIVTAISRCDQFDFLIDIVPREEIKQTPPEALSDFSSSPNKTTDSVNQDAKKTSTTTSTTDPIQYLLQLGTTGNSIQPIAQIINPGGTTGQTIQTVPLNQQLLSGGPPALTPINVMTSQNMLINPQTQSSLVNSLQQQSGSVTAVQASSQANNQQAGQNQPMQIFQQVIGSNGEIQTVPITLPQNQLNFIRIQGLNAGNANHQAQPQFIIQQPGGAIQVAAGNSANAAQPTTSQNIFVNQNAIQQVLNKGNVNVTNFRTN